MDFGGSMRRKVVDSVPAMHDPIEWVSPQNDAPPQPPQPKNPWHERLLGMIDGPAREYSPNDAVDLRAPDIPWY